jgi:hypothetical protein
MLFHKTYDYAHLILSHSYRSDGPAGCGWVLKEMDEHGTDGDVSNCCFFGIAFTFPVAKTIDKFIVAFRSLLAVEHTWATVFQIIKLNTKVYYTV